MNDFVFHIPTEFVFGSNAELQVGKYIKKYGSTNVLLHYGGSSAEKSGLLQRIEISLQDEKISYTMFGGVQANPESSLVYEGIELCRKEKIDFILAVGGGSVIDSAKAIGIGVNDTEDIWEYYINRKSPKCTIPVGVVLLQPQEVSARMEVSLRSREMVTNIREDAVQSLCVRYLQL